MTVFNNNTAATVTGGGTTALASGTGESWTVTSIVGFPTSLVAGQSFHVADTAPGMSSEKVVVTAITGSGPYTWTVVRGDESSPTLAHTANFNIQQVVTAGEFAFFTQTFNVRSYGARGDGSTDDTTVIQAAVNAANSAGNGVVYFPPAVYRTSAPVTVPSGVVLRSDTRGMGSPFDSYGLGSLPVSGAILKPLSGFSSSGFNGNAVLLMDNSAGSSQMGNQGFYGISIDGSAMSTNSTAGIESVGAVAAVTIEKCFIYKVGGNGIYANLDSSFRPGNLWDVSHTHISDCGTWGVSMPGTADSFLSNVRVASCGSGGFFFADQANTKVSQCHAEWTNGPGFELQWNSVTGYMELTGCTTEHNWNDGYYITGSHASTAHLTGCRSLGDGSNNGSGGGGYAGIRASGFAGTVDAPGFVCLSATSPSCPQYGASLVSSSNLMVLPNAFLQGTTNLTNDDGTNTRQLVYTAFDSAAYSSTSLSLLGRKLANCQAANMEVNDASVVLSPASGTLYLTSIMLSAGQVISKMVACVNSTGETGGTHGWYVLCDSSMTVRAVTADQTGATAFGQWTDVTLNFTASYTVPATGRYFVGLCVVATGMPTFTGMNPPQISGTNFSPNWTGASSTGQTTPPSLGATVSSPSPSPTVPSTFYIELA